MSKPASQPSSTSPAWVACLAITAFLAPYIGGNLNLEGSTLGPGLFNIVASLFDGVDTPGLADLIVVLGALTCIVGLSMRRVLQLPNNRVAIALLVFVSVLTGSVFVSNFKSVSIAMWTHWVAYALVLFAAASASGRVRGPVVVLGAFVAGCSLSAVLAIREWGMYRAVDPTWRVFAVWNNPNALAGILLIGLVVALALMVTTDHLAPLAYGAAAVLIGFALFLTQSRGGLVAAFIGVVGVVLATLLSKGVGRKAAALRLAGALASILLIVGVVTITSRTAKSALGQRLAAGGPATEQSVQFRKNLWRGALKSIANHPVGTGIGTYSYYSAESGLVTETQLAHSTPVQLAVEGSVLAPVALLGLLVIWIAVVARGKRPEPRANVLRGAIIAAVVAAAIDGLGESNLYFFGTGVAIFMLMGLGLQLAADAVAPEYTPPPMRRLLAVGVAVVVALLAFFGYREVVKGQVRFARATNTTPDFEALKSGADGDGEAHYLLGFNPNLSPADRISEFRQAAELEPSVKHLKYLALATEQSDDSSGAVTLFNQALRLDPNNMDLLARLLEFDQSHGHPDEAKATAERLVAVEQTPYFKVRALSEIVPLQTADGHVYLASQTTDHRQAAVELRAAAQLYLQFTTTSVPYLRSNWHDQPTDLPMAGETQHGVSEKLAKGVEVARSAAIAFRATNDPTEAERMDQVSKQIQSVLDEFTGALAAGSK